MSRLYDYDGGSIRIGGLDIKEISTKSLFEKIAIVFQDVTLFNASVLENIRIGKRRPQMRKSFRQHDWPTAKNLSGGFRMGIKR